MLKVAEAAEHRARELAQVMFELNADGGEASQAMLINEGFSAFEIEKLKPLATQLANRRFVRQVDADPDAPSDDEIVEIAVANCLGLVDAGTIVETLRHRGIPARTVGRLWDKITVKLAGNVARLPKPAQVA